jgi:hypothetical protein
MEQLLLGYNPPIIKKHSRGQWVKSLSRYGDGEWHWEAFWQGFSAKHYMEETQRHSEFYKKIYPTDKEAMKVIKRVCRHFKILPVFEFTNLKRGLAYYSGKIILPSKNISLGLICHEIAHLVAYKRFGEVGHNKKYQRKCDSVCRFSKRYLDR